jgi:hypothetical protein
VVEGMGLKINALRSPVVASPLYKISSKPTNGLLVTGVVGGGGGRRTYRQKHKQRDKNIFDITSPLLIFGKLAKQREEKKWGKTASQRENKKKKEKMKKVRNESKRIVLEQ